jgi:CBS-domain-containing membrane protein
MVSDALDRGGILDRSSAPLDWRSDTMKAKDVMTSPVISVDPNATVLQATRMMLERRISGLPVIDGSGHLLGMITEGDFLRRVETGTQRQRPRWLEFQYRHGIAQVAGLLRNPLERKIKCPIRAVQQYRSQSSAPQRLPSRNRANAANVDA